MRVNNVGISGNLCAAPELRYTRNGKPVTDLRLAHNPMSKQNDRGEWVQQGETLFITATVWGAQAELCSKHLAKGKRVYVEGRLDAESWTDQETSQKRTTMKITCRTVQWDTPSKSKGGASSRDDRDDAGAPDYDDDGNPLPF